MSIGASNLAYDDIRVSIGRTGSVLRRVSGGQQQQHMSRATSADSPVMVRQFDSQEIEEAGPAEPETVPPMQEYSGMTSLGSMESEGPVIDLAPPRM